MKDSNVTHNDLALALARIRNDLREEIRDRTQGVPMMYDVSTDTERAVTQDDWAKSEHHLRLLSRFRAAITDIEYLLVAVHQGAVPEQVFYEAVDAVRRAAHGVERGRDA